MPFESSLESLREILSDLENGNLPLEESLAKYESGIAHLRNCHATLNDAKKKIEQLVRLDSDGKAITKAYAHAATFGGEEEADDVEDNDDDEHDEEELVSELEDEQERKKPESQTDDDWDGGLF